MASPNPSVRRSIISAVLTVLEAYKSAFRVQISNALAHTPLVQTETSPSSGGEPISARTVDDLLDEIFVDALGFLGLYPLFLSVAFPDKPMLSLDEVYGMNWGDRDGRFLSIRRRHLLSISDALSQFLHLHSSRSTQGRGSGSTGGLSDAERLSRSSKAIMSVFASDEDRFLTCHPTEFWF